MDNDMGVVGTAPGARIWSVQVLDKNGNGEVSDIMKGLTFVAKHFKDIEVVNISTAGFGFSIPVAISITALVGKGVVVVVAAGNHNIDANNVWPANVPVAITVSAITDSDGKCGGAGPAIPAKRVQLHQKSTTESLINPDDFIASYSNFGSVVDLAAPGGVLASTDNTGGYSNTDGSTSYAAAHVAGAAALLKSIHSGVNPFRIEAFFDMTGTKAPATGNPLLPCDGAGRGYFNDEYPRSVPVLKDTIKEPLLYMGPMR